MDAFKQLLEWLENNLPAFLAAFGLGYELSEKEKASLEAELLEAHLEIKLRENEIQNEIIFVNKSSDTIIREVLSGEPVDLSVNHDVRRKE